LFNETKNKHFQMKFMPLIAIAYQLRFNKSSFWNKI
jgi:hypothetical protein